MVRAASIACSASHGGVAERSNAPVLKTGVRQPRTAGSNPAPSAVVLGIACARGRFRFLLMLQGLPQFAAGTRSKPRRTGHLLATLGEIGRQICASIEIFALPPRRLTFTPARRIASPPTRPRAASAANHSPVHLAPPSRARGTTRFGTRAWRKEFAAASIFAPPPGVRAARVLVRAASVPGAM